MDLVDGLRAFVATAQSGSFTEAAERLGISNRLTSKYVGELETRIGARLLQRTTRKVGLSPSGQMLLARAPALLDELDQMLGSISEDSQGYTGLLRISAPVTFGEIYIKDLLARFAEHHPGLDIDLRLNDSYVDLASEGFDLAFRVGTPDVASFKVRKLGSITTQLVASPDYLTAHAPPRTPDDLGDHVCIVDSNQRDAVRWVFLKGGDEFVFTAPRRFLVNSARVARDWAAAGRGISVCPDFVLTQHIEDGRLVRLLDNYHMHSHPVSAIYLQGNVLSHKVRALIDFAVEDIRESGLFWNRL